MPMPSRQCTEYNRPTVHVVLGSLVRLYKPHALDLTIANTWIRPSS